MGRLAVKTAHKQWLLIVWSLYGVVPPEGPGETVRYPSPEIVVKLVL